MTNPTSNFGWQMPTSTDLVTDLPADFETFGQAVDTSLAGLKGGTTGQVLSKTSNTDMAFTWVAQDDSNAIQNAIVDAKGDLIAASAADTPARLAVGNNGETLVADSSTSTGLRYQGNFAAGKNKIINGDFGIWQRGTSFSLTSTGGYQPDRFQISSGSGGTCATTQQTFTPGTAPVAGYEGQYFLQVAFSVSGTSTILLEQMIEDVRTLAGQTATFSFWGRVTSGTFAGAAIENVQRFGTGGSGAVVTSWGTANFTTSWQRFTGTVTIPSVSGKTIGASSSTSLRLNIGTSGTSTFQIWGVQVEAGSVATAFQTATGTIQGELAACQRYYQRFTGTAYGTYALAYATSTTNAYVVMPFQTQMRTAPTVLDYSSLAIDLSGTSASAVSVLAGSQSSSAAYGMNATTTGLTAFRTYDLCNNNTTSGYIGFGAEL